MLKSVVLRSCFSPVLVEAKDVHRSELSPPSCRASTIRCSLRNYANIPKLKPFSRTLLDRVIKEPPLIEKAESELAGINYRFLSDLRSYSSVSWSFVIFPGDLSSKLGKNCILRMISILVGLILIFRTILCFSSDYCTTLEGEESYYCWKACFELEDLEVCLQFQFVLELNES